MYSNFKTGILIQARLSSSRFPKKMLHNLKDYKLVEYVYKRCKSSKEANDVIVITSNDETDNELYEYCINRGMVVYRGSLDDVLNRYINAAKKNKIDLICRVCGDSPFVDIHSIDKMFKEICNSNLEYIYTTDILNGFMSEVFTLDLLQRVYNFELTKEDKEHVTKFVRDNIKSFKTKQLSLNLMDKSIEEYTLTVDYPEDLKIAEKIANELDSFDFKSIEILNILKNMKDKK